MIAKSVEKSTFPDSILQRMVFASNIPNKNYNLTRKTLKLSIFLEIFIDIAEDEGKRSNKDRTALHHFLSYETCT